MLRLVLGYTLFLATCNLYAAPLSPPKKITLEDLNATLQRIEQRLYRSEMNAYRQAEAVRSFNKCHDSCNEEFSKRWRWKDHTEEENEEHGKLVEDCHESCPKLPDSVVGGC